MTRLEALKELLAKVEAGGCSWITFEIAASANVITNGGYWAQAHEGSLDAAKALHEEVLPDAAVQLTDMRPYRGSGGWLVSINWHSDKHQGANADPTRAWLIAILKALIAQEQAA